MEMLQVAVGGATLIIATYLWVVNPPSKPSGPAAPTPTHGLSFSWTGGEAFQRSEGNSLAPFAQVAREQSGRV